jgi:hypothetical protein
VSHGLAEKLRIRKLVADDFLALGQISVVHVTPRGKCQLMAKSAAYMNTVRFVSSSLTALIGILGRAHEPVNKSPPHRRG